MTSLIVFISLPLLLLLLLRRLLASVWRNHHALASHSVVVKHAFELSVGLEGKEDGYRVEKEEEYKQDGVKASETIIERIIGFHSIQVVLNGILDE